MNFKKLLAGVLSASMLLSMASFNLNSFASENNTVKKAYKVSLKTATLEPKRVNAAPKQLSAANSQVKEAGPYIIVFTGPVSQSMKDSVIKAGANLDSYLPDNAFYSYISSDTAQKVKDLECVADVIPYESQYKIDPGLMEKVSGQDEKSPDKEVKISISTFNTDLSILESEIAKNNTQKVYSDKDVLIIKTNLNNIINFSKINAVKYIEEAPEYKLTNNIASGIIGAEQASNYGYEGEGQVVGVADSGLDNGIDGINNNTIHADLRGRIDSIIDPFGTNGIDENGHGTHVTGSIIGNGQMSNEKIKGMAPEAHVVFQKIANALGQVTINSINNLLQQAYDNGVRIHSNSWGSSSMGVYNKNCKDVDSFLWQHKDMTVLYSSGNEGPGNNTVGSPGAAKNCLTVGATENYRPYEKLYNGLSISDNPDEAAFFSSRGCADGRIKPDVVAPGTYIASTLSSNAQEIYLAYPGNSNYQYMHGTSMATPITTGSVAAIREYIQETYNITPSAALIKAFVINGALSQGYTQDKGWGKVSIYDSLFSSHIINDSASVAHGQTQTYSTQCNVTRSDMPLKITLVWTDYPGDETAPNALVNNLDLKVTSPNGTVVYNGNDFTSPYNSEVDNKNNVENVIINTPVSGTYTVEVTGTNVQYGPQPYALVYSSDFFSTPKNLKAPSNENSITVSWDAVPGATGYDIEVDGATILSTSGTSYIHSNLTANSEHTYRVRAKNSQNTGDWSYTLTGSTKLATPIVTSKFVGESIELSWEPVAQATSYDIYAGGKCVASQPGCSYIYNYSTPETTYEFFVKARTDFNSSDSSNTLEVKSPDIGVTYKSPMIESRIYFGTAASQNGKIYVMGGKKGPFYLNTVEEYDPSNNSWTQKAPMQVAKIGLGAVEANNGKIYVMGGFNGSAYLKTVQEYDPATDTWTNKTDMPTAKSNFGIVYVNGKIYTIGGYNGSTLDNVEVYDPTTDTWTIDPNMPTARSEFGISTLSGKIIVMGGIYGSENIKAVEEYDPITKVWTIKKSLNDWNSAFSLSEYNGKLYISGGANSNKIEEYDPETCSSTVVAQLPVGIYGHASVVQNGLIYIIGGFGDATYFSTVIQFDPQKDGWVKKASMPAAKAFFSAETVNGKIYTLGGEDDNFRGLDTVEEYDIASDTWSICPSLSTKKFRRASATVDGKIYVCGGEDNNYKTPYSNVLEVYDPVNEVWTVKTPMPEGRACHNAVAIEDNIYIIGGQKSTGPDSQGVYNSAYANTVLKYDTNNDSWTVVTTMPTPRRNHGLAVSNGKIYVIGGITSNGYTNSIDEYDPVSNTWTSKSPLPQAISMFATSVINDRIYIIGGSSGQDLTTVREYDPKTDTFTLKQNLPTKMARHQAVYAGNKIYTFGSMLDLGNTIGFLDSMYAYSPSDSLITKVTVGSEVMEPKSGAKSIPLTISNTPSNGVYKADLSIQYDPAVLTVTGITPGEAIPDGYGITCNIDNSEGMLVIHYTGDINTQKLITADGVLANIEFDVLDSVNTIGSSSINLLESDCKLYNPALFEYKCTKMVNGYADIFIYGDVDGSSTVTTDDYNIFRDSLMCQEQHFPYEYGRLTADVNGDGLADTLDLALILQYTRGEITKFPVQQ